MCKPTPVSEISDLPNPNTDIGPNGDLSGSTFIQSADVQQTLEDNLNNVIGAKEFESLVDKLAYKISRKIWYVGRRPHNLTDNQWNELTKFMRPKEGSYGGGDVWTNFKYTTNYEYTSGVSE